MELHAILAVLFDHSRVHVHPVRVYVSATVTLYRSGALALLSDNSHVVDINDRHADRFDDNATRDRQESVHCQRRGEKR